MTTQISSGARRVLRYAAQYVRQQDLRGILVSETAIEASIPKSREEEISRRSFWIEVIQRMVDLEATRAEYCTFWEGNFYLSPVRFHAVNFRFVNLRVLQYGIVHVAVDWGKNRDIGWLRVPPPLYQFPLNAGRILGITF